MTHEEKEKVVFDQISNFLQAPGPRSIDIVGIMGICS